ncbi:MAG: hypothetical protein BWK80_51160 [Desulfobacteraceae bacterium IS3]|nr:MAG: hypothetical protein BWK80_51160 [Desulfobacteraceae bacterium IS3]
MPRCYPICKKDKKDILCLEGRAFNLEFGQNLQVRVIAFINNMKGFSVRNPKSELLMANKH